MKIFKPEVFQGNLSAKHYFEGWYFKNVSKELEHVYSFIPGVSLNPENPHAFIQVINGITGQTQYIEYPLSSFSFSRNDFKVQVGESVFTSDSILLNIDSPLINVSGRLGFSGTVKYPASLLSPGIMGWYSFVPFMECKHAVVSVTHRIDGCITINNEQFDFSGGHGYIEKDWGKSFPESWIWLQSNNFANSDASIMMSIAKIPWLGSYFTGFLCFLYQGGHFYSFSTYEKSEIIHLSQMDEKLLIILRNKKFQLEVSAQLSQSGILLAPKHGAMNRRIKESVDSELEVELSDIEGHEVFHDVAHRAGLEVIEGIFDLVKIKPNKKIS